MTIRSMPATRAYRENYERIFERPRRERAEREKEAVTLLTETFGIALATARAIVGLPVELDPGVPAGEVELRGAGGQVVRAINIAPADPADDPDAAE